MSKKKADTSEEITQLAQRIKALRKEAGYTNYEYFAYDNNIARSLYSRFESGQDMRFSSIVKVAKAHNISLKEFFGEGFE